ncbi:hypothetical protein MNEG_12073 [Monoraphidium neglectum]|uniref:FAS1 domain-containing protein n=1 Tax=Monoraphidium neglectum TaxID=145388 RepID=A0A0D2LWM9_9CHLO|nr:hypothetical protein MNEG_12073 [Monoraphidium neglectum]KIY95889.1 hypothetical protein MNEG_12073 [Monoraphidium neglectum]|eukprot:XP_013894909.1 hypothetical protein MNEG_12073 [Monoraphidium neglectum]
MARPASFNVAWILMAALMLRASSAEGPHADVVDAAKAAGATRFVELIKAAGAADVYSKNSPAMGMAIVLLAPTNTAVDAWLKESNLDLGSLKDRKALAQRVVGYLTLLPSSDLSKLKPGASATVTTANPAWNLTVSVSKDGKLSANDSHNAVVTLVPTSAHNVFTTSKLLLPGNVFPSMDDMDFKMSGAGGHESMVSPFTLFEAAADRAQIEKDLKAHGATVFVPTDAAFKAAGLTKDAIAKADPATLKSILLYHSVPGYRPIPKGFTSGKPVPTLLKGADLTVVLSEEKMAGGYRLGHATVKDAAGNVANVVAPNQFVLSSTVHAIDKVLSPSAGKAGAATATKAPAPKSMAAAARKMAGRHRRLLGFREGGDLFNGLASNNAHDAVLAATAAHAGALAQKAGAAGGQQPDGVNSDSPDSAFRATQVAQINANYAVYPTTRPYFLVGGAGGGLN